MTDDTLPITLVARMGDVAIFQTAAWAVDDEQRAALDDSSTSTSTSTSTPHPPHHASYGALNLGLHVYDQADKVLGNRMSLLSVINKHVADPSSPDVLAIKRLHWVNQVHGKHIYDVDAVTLNLQPVAADAMVSQQRGLGLAIMTADCVPIVLYQPSTGQIAAIHAGWQGLACGVIQATVNRFQDSGAINAWIGVCISQSNYEVSGAVRDKLLAGCRDNHLLSAQSISPASFEQRYVTQFDPIADDDHRPQHLHKAVDKASQCATVVSNTTKVDLPKLAADQLRAAGVRLDNELPIPCSYGNERYYSYRRQTHLRQPATGRMALVIVRAECTK